MDCVCTGKHTQHQVILQAQARAPPIQSTGNYCQSKSQNLQIFYPSLRAHNLFWFSNSAPYIENISWNIGLSIYWYYKFNIILWTFTCPLKKIFSFGTVNIYFCSVFFSLVTGVSIRGCLLKIFSYSCLMYPFEISFILSFLTSFYIRYYEEQNCECIQMHNMHTCNPALIWLWQSRH